MADDLFNIPLGANTEQFDRDVEKAVKNATKNDVRVNVLPDVRNAKKGDDSAIRSAAKTAVQASTEYSNSISGALSEVGSGRIQGVFQNTVSGIYRMGNSFAERGKDMYETIKGVQSNVEKIPSMKPPSVSANKVQESDISESISRVAETIKNSSESIPSISSSSKPKNSVASYKDGGGGSAGDTKLSAGTVNVRGNAVYVTGKVTLPNVQGSTGVSASETSSSGGGSKEVKMITSKVESGVSAGMKNAVSKMDNSTKKIKTKNLGEIKGSALKSSLGGAGAIAPAISSMASLAEAGADMGSKIAEDLGKGIGEFLDVMPNKFAQFFGKVAPTIGKVASVGLKAGGTALVAGLGAMGAAIGIISYLGGKYREQIVKQDSTIGATGRWITGGGSYFRNEQVAEANLSLGRQTGEQVFGRNAMMSKDEMKFATAMGVPLNSLAEVLGGMRKEGNKPMTLATMRGFANALGYTNMRQMEFIQLLSQQIGKERQEGVKKPSGKEFLQYLMGVKGTQELKYGVASKLSDMGKQGINSQSPFELMMFGKASEKYGSLSEAELSMFDPEKQIEIFNGVLADLTGGKNLKRGTQEFDNAYNSLKFLTPQLNSKELESLLSGDTTQIRKVMPQYGTKAGSVPGAGLSNREEGMYLNKTGQQAFELALKIESGLMSEISKHSSSFQLVTNGLGKAVDFMFEALDGMDKFLENQKKDREDSIKNDEALLILQEKNTNLIDAVATKHDLVQQMMDKKIKDMQYRVEEYPMHPLMPGLGSTKRIYDKDGKEIDISSFQRNTEQEANEYIKKNPNSDSLRGGPFRAVINALKVLEDALERIPGVGHVF